MRYLNRKPNGDIKGMTMVMFHNVEDRFPKKEIDIAAENNSKGICLVTYEKPISSAGLGFKGAVLSTMFGSDQGPIARDCHISTNSIRSPIVKDIDMIRDACSFYINQVV